MKLLAHVIGIASDEYRGTFGDLIRTFCVESSRSMVYFGKAAAKKRTKKKRTKRNTWWPPFYRALCLTKNHFGSAGEQGARRNRKKGIAQKLFWTVAASF